MSNLNRSRLDELKIKACLLLKNLKDTDPEKSRKAAQRFTQLSFLSGCRIEQVLSDSSLLKLKHALLVIALENGCNSWTSLRDKIIKEDCLYYANGGSILNHWFGNYPEAKQFQALNGGYLLQYRQHYFICPEEFIEQLGLSSFKEEWEAIGYDWTNVDRPEWNILFQQAKHNYLNRPTYVAAPDKSKRPEWITK